MKYLFLTLLIVWSVLILSALFYSLAKIPIPLFSAPALPADAEPAASRPKVILDAGHGGADPGAISVHGDPEKEINLSVVQKIGAFLENAGAEVIYTRTEDQMLQASEAESAKTGDLLGRVKIAREHPDALFISIHMNTLAIEKYNGLQVFYSQKNSANRPLAQAVQNEVIAMLQPNNTRQAKDAEGKIYILDRMENPAILIECGFLSNREEASLLMDETYRTQLAFAIAHSLLPYLLENQKN
jgi:N-acetylmuramoyl-L-alanine amidase